MKKASLILLLFLAGNGNADSVWDKRKDDGPRVDRFFFDEDPYLNQARVVMLGGGLQGYYQRRTFLFPSLDLEVSVWRYLTLGAFINLYSSSDTGYSYTAYEALGTINIYPFGKFDMLFLRLGGGLFGTNLSGGSRSSSSSFTALGMLGWRFLIFDPVSLFNIGFAVGGQNYSISGRSTTLPTALLEVALFL